MCARRRWAASRHANLPDTTDPAGPGNLRSEGPIRRAPTKSTTFTQENDFEVLTSPMMVMTLPARRKFAGETPALQQSAAVAWSEWATRCKGPTLTRREWGTRNTG